MHLRYRTRQKIRYGLPFALLGLVIVAAGGYAVWLVTNGGTYYEEPEPIEVQVAQIDSVRALGIERSLDTTMVEPIAPMRVSAPIIASDSDSTIVKRSLYRKQKEDVHIDLSQPADYVSLKEWLLLQWKHFKAERAAKDSLK